MLICFGELEELNARSKYLDDRSLTRGLLSAFFLPVNESSYILNGIGLKVGFNEKDCTDRVLFSSDLCTNIKLRDLQLADCSIYFPELAFSFSPDDISIYLALDKLLSNKHNHARSARELWRLAASRMGNTIIPRLSLHRLVSVISQWVHYVNAYENLLLLVGYSSGLLLNRSISKISWNKHTLSSARHHWKVISDTEKKLPVEGIALARRVARHRAMLKVQSDSEKCVIPNPFNFFHPLFATMILIWKVISKIIQSLVNFLFLRKEIVKDPYIDGGLGSLTKDPCQRCCFILNFGKLVILVSQTSRIHPAAYDKLKLRRIEFMDYHSISFFIEPLSFVSVEDIFEQRVFLSCGRMKVMPTCFKESSKSSKMNMLNSETENRKEGINDTEPILWVEPAKSFFVSEVNDAQAKGSCAFHVENLLGKICLSWKGMCDSLIESELEYSENPSLLCKVERSFTYPGLNNPDFGFPECGLILGKLNLVLTHCSVSSVSLLLSQIQHSLWWEDKGKTSIASNCMGKPEICWVNKFEYYAKGWIMTLLEMLPEKNIQLGVFVDGPSVRFLHKAGNPGQEINDIVSQDSFVLIFDFHEIEVAIGSPSISGMVPLVDLLGFDDAEAKCFRLEPQAIQIPKPNNDKYASWGNISFDFYLHLNGLNACLRKPAESHQVQFFVLKPITLQMSSFR